MGPTPPARVAVSMPAHNAARFVSAAIASVLAQRVPLHLYVVDDGSGDETAAVVRDRSDSRLTLLSNERRLGIGASHNRVIAASRAPFVAHVDADDVIEPGALGRMIDALESRPDAAQAYCDFYPLDDSGAVDPREVERWRRFFVRHRRPPIDYGRELIEHGMVVSALRTYRRSALQAVGGFDEELDWAVDYEMALRLAESYTFVHVPEMLYGRRVHAEGTSQRVPVRLLSQWWRRRMLVGRQLRRQRGRILGRGRLGATGLLLSGLRSAISASLGAKRSPVR